MFIIWVVFLSFVLILIFHFDKLPEVIRDPRTIFRLSINNFGFYAWWTISKRHLHHLKIRSYLKKLQFNLSRNLHLERNKVEIWMWLNEITFKYWYIVDLRRPILLISAVFIILDTKLRCIFICIQENLYAFDKFLLRMVEFTKIKKKMNKTDFVKGKCPLGWPIVITVKKS